MQTLIWADGKIQNSLKEFRSNGTVIKVVSARILDLPIKKQWFDMIASGEKKEEYRKLSRHWQSRLVKKIITYDSHLCLDGRGYDVEWREYDFVRLRNGYRKDSPKIFVEFKGTRLGKGKPEWGAVPGEEYFVISLGKVI